MGLRDIWSACDDERRDALRDRSLTGWLSEIGCVVLLSAKDLWVDRGPQWAAAVAYYSLLSVFPLLLASLTIASFFVSPDWAADQITQRLGNLLPTGEQQVQQIVTGAYQARTTAGLLSVIPLLWTGTRVFATLTIALNIAYGAKERYSFLKRLLIEFLMLLTLGVVLILALSANFLLNVLLQFLQFLPTQSSLIVRAVEFIIRAGLLLAAFFLIYRFVPRGGGHWRAALPSAVTATAIYLIAQPLFLYFINQFGQYNLIYGSLAIAIILMLWAWIVALIILFGGELTAHIQHVMLERQSIQTISQRHEQQQQGELTPTHGATTQRSEESARRERAEGQAVPPTPGKAREGGGIRAAILVVGAFLAGLLSRGGRNGQRRGNQPPRRHI